MWRTDEMTAYKLSILGAKVVLVTLLASFAAFAQDAVPDAVADAVERELIEPTVDTSSAAAEIDETEPAVPSSVLSSDVTRSQSGDRVMDRMELGRTEITGNQELPKVLYIVPWQKANPGDLMGRPVNTLLDEVLAPVDREEFVRTVDYYDDIYGEESE